MKTISIRMSDELVGKLDMVRGVLSRSAYIKNMIDRVELDGTNIARVRDDDSVLFQDNPVLADNRVDMGSGESEMSAYIKSIGLDKIVADTRADHEIDPDELNSFHRSQLRNELKKCVTTAEVEKLAKKYKVVS